MFLFLRSASKDLISISSGWLSIIRVFKNGIPSITGLLAISAIPPESLF